MFLLKMIKMRIFSIKCRGVSASPYKINPHIFAMQPPGNENALKSLSEGRPTPKVNLKSQNVKCQN